MTDADALDPGTPPADDHGLAAWLATVAGRRLLEVRGQGLEGRALKDAGDQAAHELLMTLLAEHRPADAVLSEEGKDDKVRLTADRVWIVDPLDGTREFSEPPRDDWAVHVALWERDADRPGGGDLTAGAVAEPAVGETFDTGHPPVVPPRTSVRPRIAVSRTRPPAFVTAMAEEMDAELVPMGSAGAKVISVARDLTDAYVHAGGQYEWDSAAPVAVARAAGLFCSRVDGSPLIYNQDDVYLPDLIVCRPELAEGILAFVGATAPACEPPAAPATVGPATVGPATVGPATVGPVTVGHVLVDADGVLQRLPGGWAAALTPYAGDRVAELVAACDADEGPSMRGEADFLDVLAPLLVRYGVGVPAAEVFADVWLRIEPQPASFSVLDRLRAAGLGVHLGTNQEARRAAYMRRVLGYDEVFDRSFYSCDVGVAKPEAGYFEAVVGVLGVAPGEVLFLDDNAANVAAARTVGLRAEEWHLDHGLPRLESLVAGYLVPEALSRPTR